MTSNERRLVVDPLVVPSSPPPRPRWHSRWGLVIAFQAGMIGVFVLRHIANDHEHADNLVQSTTTPPVATPAEPVAVAPAATPDPPTPPSRPSSPSRTTAARARPAAPSSDSGQLIEVELVSNPPGATVRIGDQVGGTTPLSAFLPATPTTIRFELDGYTSYATRWSPRTGRRVAAVLEPTP
ncbi:MAG: PEGA domain-containing protein [Kofleriaceae bacterium]